MAPKITEATTRVIERRQRMRRHHIGEPRHRDQGGQAYEQPARRGADDEGDGELERRERRHQEVDRIALHLGDDQRRGRILEGVRQDRHHDQARGQAIGVGALRARPIAVAQHQAKHHHEQQRLDQRGEDGLRADLQEALISRCTSVCRPNQFTAP
jgi:hypothetical protein